MAPVKAHNSSMMTTTRYSLTFLSILMRLCVVKGSSVGIGGSQLQQEDSYIVEFQQNVGLESGESMLTAALVDKDDNSYIEYRYEDLFEGLSLRNASDSTIDRLKAMDFVMSVTLVRKTLRSLTIQDLTLTLLGYIP